MNKDYIYDLKELECFDRDKLFETMSKYNTGKTTSSFKKELQDKLSNGEIVRKGRNSYSLVQDGIYNYGYNYSDRAQTIAAMIKEGYPLLDFRICELFQLNDFVRHQLAHNIIFVSVEKDAEAFVFDTLSGSGIGSVMLAPGIEEFHRYRSDDMIVITKLPTESPKGKEYPWHTCLEKLLVDIVADRLLRSTFSENETDFIFETAFTRYVIDESKLMRYARRRHAGEKIKKIVKETD